MMRRRAAVVTGSRADYGSLRPLVETLRSVMTVELLVSGMHLSGAFGASVREVEADGFPVAARIHTLVDGQTDTAIAESIGLATCSFGRELSTLRPDVLILFGDRHEMFAAACAAIPLRIRIAHIGGGENTVVVSTDVTYRAAMTKMSHLHFVSTEPYRQKVLAMGEESWRIHVVGALGIDAIKRTNPIPRPELEAELGLRPNRPIVVVTYHPVTMTPDSTHAEIAVVLSALESFADIEFVFTYPGADASYADIVDAIELFAAGHPNAHIARSLGSQRYLSLLAYAKAMVGNSST